MTVLAAALVLACGGTPQAQTPAPAAPLAATTSAPATSAPTVKSNPTSAAPQTVAMPNVVKKNAAVAEDELKKLGFTKIQFGSQDAEDKVVLLLANWTVTKQSTAAGEQVTTDTLIVLTCTKKV
ncbi:hypothetical protein GCM10018962_75310 [Dactylosporangium matsuzakiense]|uniref:PASTA domain-containing protein n=1 Tax=Dactylosporangium matsuzakiense TaxID=53360 RepID=A0A9W6KY79_9ACTN|nr:hypothetical protein GCM10017581_094130 [Dactylosporangium matsuzakiense]